MLGEILILALMVLLTAFFAASEMSIISARKARLRQKADEENHAGAARAIELAEDSGRFLSSVQIGITILSVLAGAYGGAKLSEPFAELLQPWLGDHAEQTAFFIVVATITYMTLVVGELVPKRLAIAHAEAVAVATAPIMHAFSRLAAPLVWILQASSNIVIRLLPFSTESDTEVTQEEVKSIIAEGAATGLFAPAEQQMLEGVMRMGDRTVRAIMTPRQSVEWIDLNEPASDELQKFFTAGYSRMPAARGSLDDIAGIIYARDILSAYVKRSTLDLAAFLREPLTVHDAMPVLRFVELLRETKKHMALVVDEHGTVEGIVTTADILEAVTGSAVGPSAEDSPDFVPREDGSWLIDGMMPIDETAAKLGLRNPKSDNDDFQTLAGFVLKMLGHLPKAGNRFIWGEHTFEVVDMDGRRIDKVLVTPPAHSADKEEA